MYCPEGSGEAIQVDRAFYSTGGTNETRSGQTMCDAGHFCDRGTKYNCPPGRYGSVRGLENGNCSGICPAGFYCPFGSTYPRQCGDSQRYCPEGSYEPQFVYK